MFTFWCKSRVVGLVLLVTTAIAAAPTMARPGEIGAPRSAVETKLQELTSTLVYTEQKLYDSAAMGDEYFGRSVALDGDTAMVGVPGRGFGTPGSYRMPGSVHVFTRSGTTWSFQQELTAPDGADFDRFGAAVALDGDTALVGAPGDTIGGNLNQGAVYVFARSGTIWSFQQKGWDPTGEAHDGFGASLALDGDTALVGAPGADVYQGAVYVFARSGTAWTFQQKGWDPAGEDYDFFGASVVLDADTAMVGALRGGAVDQGAVYIFTRSGTTWSFQQQGWDPEGEVGDSFGASLALDGDTVIAGAPGDDIGENEDQGSAYVFTRSGDTWSFQQKGWDPAGAAYDRFGGTVALHGDTALVGASGSGDPNTPELPGIPGSAYLLNRIGATWSLQEQLTAADGQIFDHFGASVALEGDTALVGAPLASIGGNYFCGAAYVYEFDAAPYVVALTRAGASPTSAERVHFDVLFSEAVTGVAGEDFALTATGTLSGLNVSGVSGSGASYVVTVATGTGEGTLRLDVPAGATIVDLVGQALSGLPYTDGELYTIERERYLYLPLVLRNE